MQHVVRTALVGMSDVAHSLWTVCRTNHRWSLDSLVGDSADPNSNKLTGIVRDRSAYLNPRLACTAAGNAFRLKLGSEQLGNCRIVSAIISLSLSSSEITVQPKGKPLLPIHQISSAHW
mmetsp:Transcript_65783/g.130351  ORF Transcript_65783/g.130351 Transcript_65783/m.130351 type:complete len:119 (-) Transcript_65783:1305-1661(-)